MVDINFTNMSVKDRKKFVIKLLLNGSSFEDISATFLDWSTSNKTILVSSQIVLRFIQSLDFNKICGELVGKKLYLKFYWLSVSNIFF